jgi:hypothetical protein
MNENLQKFIVGIVALVVMVLIWVIAKYGFGYDLTQVVKPRKTMSSAVGSGISTATKKY